MGSNDNSWNFMAGIALDQILERNENGNLSPLTQMEITVLSEIRGMLIPENPQNEEPVSPPAKKGGKKVPAKEGIDQKDSASKSNEREFKTLDNKDLT